MSVQNKTQKVKEHLLSKGSITSWEAIKLYRATRLSSIIFNLRKEFAKDKKYDIDSIPTKSKDNTTFSTYKLTKTINFKNK